MTIEFTQEEWQNPGENSFLIQLIVEKPNEKPLIQVFEFLDPEKTIINYFLPNSLTVVTDDSNCNIVITSARSFNGYVVLR